MAEAMLFLRNFRFPILKPTFMRTYLLLFRAGYDQIAKVSEEEMKQRNLDWAGWVDTIAARGLLEGGNHLGNEGKVVRADTVTDGTVTAEGMSVLGYLLLKASSDEEAVKIARDCPILAGEGNSVEVRPLYSR